MNETLNDIKENLKKAEYELHSRRYYVESDACKYMIKVIETGEFDCVPKNRINSESDYDYSYRRKSELSNMLYDARSALKKLQKKKDDKFKRGLETVDECIRLLRDEKNRHSMGLWLKMDDFKPEKKTDIVNGTVEDPKQDDQYDKNVFGAKHNSMANLFNTILPHYMQRYV